MAVSIDANGTWRSATMCSFLVSSPNWNALGEKLIARQETTTQSGGSQKELHAAAATNVRHCWGLWQLQLKQNQYTRQRSLFPPFSPNWIGPAEEEMVEAPRNAARAKRSAFTKMKWANERMKDPTRSALARFQNRFVFNLRAFAQRMFRSTVLLYNNIEIVGIASRHINVVVVTNRCSPTHTHTHLHRTYAWLARRYAVLRIAKPIHLIWRRIGENCEIVLHYRFATHTHTRHRQSTLYLALALT